MPKVSVVTGFFNRGALLERTISSILEQTYRDLELYVFDDKSTDDTAERLAELAARLIDSRFRYAVHPENLGLVQGLRDAIEATSGEYIAIQGSGDVSLPERIARQVAFLEENPNIGLVGGWRYSKIEGSDERRLFKVLKERPTFEDVLRENFFSHGEVMFRRSVYERVGGYRTEFTFAQDRELWIRMAQVSELAVIQAPIYERYQLPDGVSYNPHKFIKQRMFSLLARNMWLLGEEERNQMLARLSDDGPDALVPASDPRIQREVTQKVLRWAFYAPDNARVLIRDYVPDRVKRRLLTTYLAVIASRSMEGVRSFAFRQRGYR